MMELVPGNSLITKTPEEGRALALTLARHSIHALQPDEAVLKGGRPKYSTDPDATLGETKAVTTEPASQDILVVAASSNSGSMGGRDVRNGSTADKLVNSSERRSWDGAVPANRCSGPAPVIPRQRRKRCISDSIYKTAATRLGRKCHVAVPFSA